MKKALSKYSYLLCFLVPVLVSVGLWGSGMFLWITPGFVFVMLPILDQLIRRDADEVPGVAQPGKVALTILGLSVIGLFFYGVTIPLSGFGEGLGLTLSLGILTGGIGNMIAHELMHKKDTVSRFIAQIFLLIALYPQFFIAHLYIHHPFAGTDKDPASARKGIGLYQFLVVSFLKNLRLSWQIEGSRKKAFWDRRITYTLGLLAVGTLCWYLGGMVGLAVYIGQGAVAIFQIESVNYIEHYGLQKSQNVRDEHLSWNARHWLSSRILLNIPRHGDHHIHPGRPFYELVHLDNSPEYPLGYPGMILIALIPPLWRKVVHPMLKNIEVSL